MIFDSLEHIDEYLCIGGTVAQGLTFLKNTALRNLAEGRHEIDGERLYALRQSYRPSPAAEKAFEAHKRYVDIQLVLSGTEIIYTAPVSGLTTQKSYDHGKDVELYRDGESSALVVPAGYFVVLFPRDAHKPGCIAEADDQVTKVVVKCRL